MRSFLRHCLSTKTEAQTKQPSTVRDFRLGSYQGRYEYNIMNWYGDRQPSCSTRGYLLGVSTIQTLLAIHEDALEKISASEAPKLYAGC